ncbi:MAG: hypothetical protein EB120_03940, partial [Proteobacteria bacterium]|nr:hypothetical protein [Pseudomonadota bacterium]
ETAQLLQLMGLGLVFWIMQILLSRGFYATQTTWLPSLFGTLLTIVFVPLYFVLSQKWGVRGLAISGSLGIACYSIFLGVLLKHHVKKYSSEISFRPVIKFGIAWTGALVLLGAMAYGISKIGIYQSSRLSALGDILLTTLVVGGAALFLLRKGFSQLTEGSLF